MRRRNNQSTKEVSNRQSASFGSAAAHKTSAATIGHYVRCIDWIRRWIIDQRYDFKLILYSNVDWKSTVDTIEVCEDSSDARNAHSRASTEDPPWLPSDSPTLIDKRKGKKKATNHQRGSGTQQTKRIRHLATRTRKVARIESTSDVFGHDRAEHGYANMVIQLSKTPPPHQPAQEHNSVPSVIEKASLVFGGHLLEFRSLSQKTQALEVVIREIDEGHRQHNDFLAEGDKLKSCVYSDAYDDTVLVPICDSLQENCIRRLSVPQENRLCPETATSDTFVVYAGVRWEFKSLLDKAEACGAALNKVLQAIDKQKDQIQQVKMQLIDKTERPRLREKRDVTRYLEFDFLARIRLWLQDNGAEFVQ